MKAIQLSNEARLALVAARSALSRGEAPGPNTAAVLVLELERLSGEQQNSTLGAMAGRWPPES